MERARNFVLCVCLGVFLLDGYQATTPTICSSCSNISGTTESANDTHPSEPAGPAETTPLINHSAGPTTSGFHSSKGPPSASPVFPSSYPQTNTVTSAATGTSTAGQEPGRDTSTPPAASTPSGSSSCTPGGCSPILLCAACVLLLS
ncbi:mediator of RNA polymerase II transcription subunit 13-like [Oryzias latipes]|uniref:mediator of RNA polymerase II transcription subunit 13-like n=1 Tax=Oryzias latipes TaxID=8090 RepID=UPI0009DB684D|nr:mediator of RNA polymerase II transcription subunit 13-like [Oryzias latipes]